jgi:hypothetical protein
MNRRAYHRRYYQINRLRRRAQRLASKYGAPDLWRAFMPVKTQLKGI